jgi:hypothetical protein
VKELRLAVISPIEEANKFLSKTYIPKTNAKFAKPPADPQDAYVPLEKRDLREILCFEYRRSVSRHKAVLCRLTADLPAITGQDSRMKIRRVFAPLPSIRRRNREYLQTAH